MAEQTSTSPRQLTHKGPGKLTEKGQATRQRITEVAAELVYKHGVAGTSIEDIRQAAGVSGSQVAHYFADKRELIRAVIARQSESVLALHQSEDLDQLDSFEALQRWAELMVAMQVQQGCVGGCRLGSLAGELVERDPEYRAEISDAYARWLQLLRGGLQTMRARGELRADADPDRLAFVLLTAHQGGVLLSQTTRSPRALQSALAAALFYVRSFAAVPELSGPATAPRPRPRPGDFGSAE